MIELLVLALFQAVLGEPAAPPATPAPPAAAAESAQPEQAQEQAAAPQALEERRMRRERVCENVEVTGRRMPQRVCRTVLVPDEPDAAAN